MVLAETYTQLMTDPAHLAFELTLELLSGVIVYPIIRAGHKRLSARLHKDLDAEHGVTHKED